MRPPRPAHRRTLADLGVIGVIGALLLAGCSSSGSSEADAPSSSATNVATEATTTTERAFTCAATGGGEHTISSDGVDRTYRFSMPKDPAGPVPLVVLFHGFASGAEEMDRVTGLDVTGPADGVAVLTPQGTGAVAGWPILAGFDVEQRFVDAAIAEVSDGGCIDADAVWIAGFSAGSAFTGFYGCSRADRVAGLVMANGLPPALCPGDRTPRVVVVNGIADPVVPFGGGGQSVEGSVIQLPTIPESVAGWAKRAGCTTGPVDDDLTDDTARTAYGDCEHGGPVELLAITGGQHAWPGAPNPTIVSSTTQSFSLSCLVRQLALDPTADLVDLAPGCPGEAGD